MIEKIKKILSCIGFAAVVCVGWCIARICRNRNSADEVRGDILEAERIVEREKRRNRELEQTVEDGRAILEQIRKQQIKG